MRAMMYRGRSLASSETADDQREARGRRHAGLQRRAHAGSHGAGDPRPGGHPHPGGRLQQGQNRRVDHDHHVGARSQGYGGNQQTCYREALAAGADVVVMVHPDYQYTPLLITAMASMVAYEVYDVVLGSRIIGGQALRGGMPLYKYISNRFLTAFENLFLRVKLSEYHTGYRAFSSKVLETLPLMENSQ